MENAAPLFGLAAMLFGSGFVIYALAHWWLQAKKLERDDRPQISATISNSAVDARLVRIEQAVDAVAVEVERLGEAQRFVAGLRAEEVSAALLHSAPQHHHPDRG